MHTELFVLCDAATDTLGKLNILGAFDAINAHQTPITHPMASIAARLRIERSDDGEHELASGKRDRT